MGWIELSDQQDVFVKKTIFPYVKKIENGLDPLTFWVIGIIYILMWISIPNLKSIGLIVLQ